METLCGKSFSKSTVSEACKELDEKVKEFKERPLTREYPFMTIDATYFKIRANSRVISKALMIAYATNSEGHREIIGFGVYRNESKETWNDFLKGLKARGLIGVRMITSDAHEGIIDAISKQFPDVPWQRCQFHFSRNITQKTPAKYQKGLAANFRICSTVKPSRPPANAGMRLLLIITPRIRKMLRIFFLPQRFNEAGDMPPLVYSIRNPPPIERGTSSLSYKDVAEEAMACLDEGFEAAMTVMVLPGYLHKYFRTSNQIERLNKELKRRSKDIGIFPNEDSLLRLMGAVLMEWNDYIASLRCMFKTSTLHEMMYRSAIKTGENRKGTAPASISVTGSTYFKISQWNPFRGAVRPLTDFSNVLKGS